MTDAAGYGRWLPEAWIVTRSQPIIRIKGGTVEQNNVHPYLYVLKNARNGGNLMKRTKLVTMMALVLTLIMMITGCGSKAEEPAAQPAATPAAEDKDTSSEEPKRCV